MKLPVTLYLLSFALALQAGFSERIQLLTNQSSYLSGEDIMVAVATTDADHRLVEFSKVAYVELTDSNRVIAQTMISIAGSTGKGILSLPEQLPTGYYRLRAYTRYMRNEGSGVFSNQLIAVVNAATLHHSELRKADRLHQETELSKSEEIDGLNQSEKQGESWKADALSQRVKQGESKLLHTNKLVYGRREKGVVSIGNLPAGAALYHVSIAADMGLNISHSAEQFSIPTAATGGETALLPEYEGHIIRAKVSGMKPAVRAVLLSVPGNPPSLMAGRKLSANDEYEFISSGLTGNIELATSIDTREDERYSFEFLSPYAPVDILQLPALSIDSTILPALRERYVALQARQAFQSKLYTYKQDKTPAGFTPEWTYRLEEYTRFNTVEEVVLEFVSNVRFRRINGIRTLAVNRDGPQGYTQGNTLVLLDNVPVFNHELLLRYDASLIEQIDIYRGQYVFSGQLYDGIVAFSTPTKDFRGFQLDRSTMINSYKGPQPGFQLTATDILQGQHLQHEPDFRTTLLFESRCSPEAIQLPFITSDLMGIYRVSITGLSSEGSEFSETIIFEVK